MPRKKISRIEIGRVSRPHGIIGEVKVQLVKEYADALLTIDVKSVFLDASEIPTKVRKCRVHQGAMLLLLEGVNTRNDSENMRGTIVSVNAADLPGLGDGEYYAHDLIGMRVALENGDVLGELVDVLATGSNDVYVVEKTDGTELLLPAIDSCVKNIDFVGELVTVVIPDGL